LTASGLSFEGLAEDGSEKWNAVRGAYTWEVVTIKNMIEFGRLWNHQSYDWLKNYVYLRQVKKGQRATPINAILTLTVSSLWHGFIPKYFIFFIFTFLNIEYHRFAFKSGEVYFKWIPMWAKDLIALIGCQHFSAVTTCLYVLEDNTKMKLFIEQIYYFPVFMDIVVFLFFMQLAGMAAAVLKKKDPKKDSKKDLALKKEK
jgi:hypothetical protein